MASLLFLFSLLLLLTTATTAVNSTTTTNATETTTVSSTTTVNTTATAINNSTTTNTTANPIITTNITTTTTTAIPPPPPPPPPPQDPTPTPIQEAHFNTIIDAIINAGDFSNWANLLARADPSTIPLSATLFVPDDDAFLDSATNHPPTTPLNFLDPLLFPYHVIPRRFSFSELLQFPTGARLPTLLPPNTLLITNNSAANFTVNGAKLTRPDLYQNGFVSVHGVGKFLDYASFGNDSASPPPAQNPTASDDVDDDYTTEFEVFGTGERGVLSAGARSSSSSQRFSWVTIVVAVIVILSVVRVHGFPGLEFGCKFERSNFPCESGDGSTCNLLFIGCDGKLV